ncbi:MAG: trypsin-like peptidase domain-containing protein [Candidatus Kapabacteria bacterium]|nr:trypsin-like peptidase domain-containing protein [Candidatus Kapabacteria bacterium]
MKKIFASFFVVFCLLCQATSAQSEIDKSRKNAITEAVKIASPAVVGINITEVIQERRSYYDSMFDDMMRFFGHNPNTGRYREVHGLGSGFIISNDGYIVTNYHVAGNASKIVITTTEGEKYDAKIVGSDKTSDVALLKIDAKKRLPFLKISNSDDVAIGEWAIAFGNPFGLFNLNAKPTVSVGVVSNAGIDFLQDNSIFKGMLQTDAAISSGNSGGPLVNAKGEVIGMNTLIFSTAQNGAGAGSIGIGWAIPSNRVMKIVEKLRKSETINRNFFLGMDLQDLDQRTARYYNIESESGVFVTRTYSNSVASKAGIDPGDLIIEINGTTIKDANDFYLNVLDGEVGQKFEFTILRGNQKLFTIFTLTERKR